MKKKVLSYKQIPVRSPFSFLVLLYLVMDKFNVSMWGWIIYTVIATLIMIGYIYEIRHQKEIELKELE
jgi:O-antigen/teichoic acid export membrane protein